MHVGSGTPKTYVGPQGTLYRASSIDPRSVKYTGMPSALAKLYSIPAAPLPGTYTPIKGVTIWINTATLDIPGWYKVAVRAYYRSCGLNDQVHVLQDQGVHRIGIYDNDGKLVGVGEIVIGYAGQATCMTKEEAEKVVARYCPTNYLGAPPNYAYICMLYHAMKADGTWDKLKSDTTLCPMRSGGLTAFIVTRDILEKLAGTPCSQRGVDELIVDYKVLFCGDGKQPGQCTDFTSWKTGITWRMDVSPPTVLNPYEAGRSLSGGFTMEVNGHIYSIFPLQSLTGGSIVIDWNEFLITMGFSFILTGIGFLMIRKSRRLRR